MMQLVTESPPLADHHHYQQLANNNLQQSLHHYQNNPEQQQQQQQQQQTQLPLTASLQQTNLEDLTHSTSTSSIKPKVEPIYTISHPLSTDHHRLASSESSSDNLIQQQQQAESTSATTTIFIAPQAVESLPLSANKSYTLTTTTTTLSGTCRNGAPNMNIQPTSFTKNHLINNNGSAPHLPSGLPSTDELSIKRRREDLSRRPSYRKIFNDLTGLSGPLDPPTAPAGLGAPIAVNPEAISNASSRVSPQQAIAAGRAPRPPTTSPSPQALDLLSSVGATTSINLQDPSATNSQSPVSVVDMPQNTVQHPTTSQPQHHHNIQPNHLTAPHLHPSSTPRQHQIHHHHQQQQQQQQQPPPHQQQHQAHHVQQHDHQAAHRPMHQIMTPTSPPMTGSGSISSGSGGGGNGEEATKKRELRLQKNREAAKECRRKKKEYIKRLENRLAVLEDQNNKLIDELKTLKDLYCKSANE